MGCQYHYCSDLFGLLIHVWILCVVLNVEFTAVNVCQHSVRYFAIDHELLLWQAHVDKGMDVIVENLANVNIDKDLELAGVNCRIAVSKFVCYLLCCYTCIFCLKSPSQTRSI